MPRFPTGETSLSGNVREWSSITGRGWELKNGRGEQVKFYPYKKKGGGGHPEGGGGGEF